MRSISPLGNQGSLAAEESEWCMRGGFAVSDSDSAPLLLLGLLEEEEEEEGELVPFTRRLMLRSFKSPSSSLYEGL